MIILIVSEYVNLFLLIRKLCIKLIEVSTGETIATAAEVYKTIEELIDSTTEIAIKLSTY